MKRAIIKSIFDWEIQIVKTPEASEVGFYILERDILTVKKIAEEKYDGSISTAQQAYVLFKQGLIKIKGKVNG